MMIDKILQYFKDFSNQNIEALSEMFSEDIHLCDWNIDVTGKENVLREIQKIYDGVESITIKPVYFYSNDKNWFACEILIEGQTVGTYAGNRWQEGDALNLEVVDVIHINDKGLIESIKAYKR
tara:strand:+ start:224 stop:592 length:369 start_codon:yes stop_codon:yes gene_type:complete